MKKFKTIAIILTLLSLTAGTFVFSTSRYKSSSLNLYATSMKSGIGTVIVDGDGFNGSPKLEFDINMLKERSGNKSLHVIDLPPGRLKTLTIIPQIDRNSFRLYKVILANETISYIWDEQGGCLQQIKFNGLQNKKEPCTDGTPTLTTDTSSIVLSAIPEIGFVNTLKFRISKALVIALGTFIAGLWLLLPIGEKRQSGLHYYGAKLCWLAVTLLFVRQLYLVVTYSVDVPIVDEWMIYFNSDALIKGLTFKWLFGFQNEHHIVLTKLMAWMNLKLFDLNFALQAVVNIFIFAGLLVAIAVFKDRLLGREKFQWFPLFICFMLSSIAVESHLWPSCSTIHLSLLFSVLMLHNAYSVELSVKSALLFSLYAVVAMYTFGVGAIFVATYLGSIAVYIVTGIIGKRIDRATGLKFLLILFSIFGLAICSWFIGYETPASSPIKVLPFDFRFWNYFLNLISSGFGFKYLHIMPGIVCLAIVVLPLLLLLTKKETRWQTDTWLVLTAILGILAVLSTISMGRAGLDWSPKTSRYTEIGFMLIPYSALGWWLAIRDLPMKTIVLSSYWLFCFVSYFDDWSTKEYALYKQASLNDLKYIEDYYSGIDIYPYCSNPADLDRAKKLGVNFTRQFKTVGDSKE